MYSPPPPFQPVPAPLPARRWWQHPALIICLLVFLPPVGIALTWTSRWSQNKKVVATVLGALWFLLLLLSDSPDDAKNDAKDAAKPTATATATAPAATATPSPTPSPTEETPAMPSLVGGSYADAEQLLTDNQGRAEAAYGDVELPAAYGTWTVCFQNPRAGAPVSSAVPVVHLTAPGTPCPKAPGEVLHKPAPKPAPTTQRPKPKPTQVPVPTQEPTPEPTEDDSSSGGSVSYRNCTAVREAGAAPIHVGDPGYGRHLDRDGDGVGCES
ncbi:excalibur calcium-binding domain-containing protein [Streptomyces sp. NBC_00691]|uniref:excalibur calcium-binding domain-containing protein n=1 Tax=Streptomyces sp. NBC_00691 TaxID=2903671 RepID=UPI003FA7774A